MDWVSGFGVASVTAMVVFYALEAQSPAYVLAFSGACLASSAYGFLAGAWPFGIVEVIWAGIALNRWRRRSGASPPSSGQYTVA